MSAVQELAIIEIPEDKALSVFVDDGAVEPYLAKIRVEIDTFLADPPSLSTKKGRDAYASMAAKVSKFRAFFDKCRKEQADKQKEIPKRIDATGRYIQDKLAAWRDEARQPLTEWEEAEEKRAAALKERIAAFDAQRDTTGLSANEIQFRIDTTELVAIDGSWQEYATEAAHKKDSVLTHLRSELARQTKYEAEQAELARLRKEAAEREQRERDERIAREAAEKAQREAEEKAKREADEVAAKAKAEREAAERRELEAKLATEKAEREKLEAERREKEALEREARAKAEAQEKADRAAKEATERAAREAEEARKREAKEAEQREANKRHAAKINNEALAAFVKGGMPEDCAKLAVTLIAKRAIPNVSISY